MSVFDDQVTDDVQRAFLDADGPAETIQYIPRVGASRYILAVIQRQTPVPLMGTTQDVTAKALVIVANHATRGISSATLDTGGDKIRFALRRGGTAESFPVKLSKAAETNDPGCLAMEV